MPVFAYGKVKPLRQAKGLNQAEIAAELGVSRPTYVLMEQGEKEPTLTQLYTLARLLGVKTEELCANLPSLGGQVADYEKFKELVWTCLAQGSGGPITKTKLAHLVYLADFVWRYHHDTPITGTTYRYTAHGPVSDDFFRALDELYEAQSITLQPEGTTLVMHTIEQRPAKRLNDEELAVIAKVCAKWRHESTEAITTFVHDRLEGKMPRKGDTIPYESILTLSEDSLY